MSRLIALLAQETAASGRLIGIGSQRGEHVGTLVALGLAAAGIWLLLPSGVWRLRRWTGAFLVGGAIAWLLAPSLASLSSRLIFGLLEAFTLLAAVATITSRSPVYSAICFAMTLLGVGGLLLVSGAQFLGVATVAVYAGAIVVTFLFVLMLSQPEGHAFYDQIGWGWFPTLTACIAGMSLVGIVVWSLSSLDRTSEDQLRQVVGDAVEQGPPNGVSVRAVHLFIDSGNAQVLRVDVAAGDQETGWEERKAELAASIRRAAGDLILPRCRIDIRDRNVLDARHVAHLGGQLFTRQLISVQLAGVLLLAALVGAIAMAGHGNESLTRQDTRGL